MLVAGGIDIKWWSSSTLVENAFSFGLGMHALVGVGCMESVDFVVW